MNNDSMPSLLLHVFDAALRGTLLALLVLLAATLLRDRPRLAAARAAVALCGGLCAQVIGSAPLFEATLSLAWQAPWIAVSVANSVLFWLFVQALFEDDFALQPMHAALWLGVMLLSLFNCLALAAIGLAPLTLVSSGLQRSMPLVFAVLAALAAARHWRDDLVEERRRVRAFIVVSGVVYTVVMLLARLASPRGRLPEGIATVDVAMLLLIVAVSAWRLLRVSGSDLFPSAATAPLGRATDAAPAERVLSVLAEGATAGAATHAAASTVPDAAEERLTQALQRLMADERIYRSDDLSVASLAARLSVPEYRLRRLINQRLGHRNFNAFVNGFRLAEARCALVDPARRALPVLTIALEAGFQSIGPFNRAFKAATGLTPTEFRRENSTDS